MQRRSGHFRGDDGLNMVVSAAWGNERRWQMKASKDHLDELWISHSSAKFGWRWVETVRNRGCCWRVLELLWWKDIQGDEERHSMDHQLCAQQSLLLREQSSGRWDMTMHGCRSDTIMSRTTSGHLEYRKRHSSSHCQIEVSTGPSLSPVSHP